MINRHRRIILGFLFTAFAVLDLVVALVGVDNVTMAAFLGVAFAQIIVLAVWSTLAPVPLFTRAGSGIVLAFLVCLSIAAASPRGESAVFAGAALGQWVAIQLPLGALRTGFGWRIVWPKSETACFEGKETQFGIRQLLIWTALIGVTFGIARGVLRYDELAQRPPEVLTVLLLLSVFNSLFAWPIIRAVSVNRLIPLWMTGAAGCCLGICLAELVAFKAVFGGGVQIVAFWI